MIASKGSQRQAKSARYTLLIGQLTAKATVLFRSFGTNGLKRRCHKWFGRFSKPSAPFGLVGGGGRWLASGIREIVVPRDEIEFVSVAELATRHVDDFLGVTPEMRCGVEDGFYSSDIISLHAPGSK